MESATNAVKAALDNQSFISTIMINLRNLSDKTAIGLSAACTAHCLLLPLALTWLPTSAALTLQDEAFHWSMVLLVIPISLFALRVGCKEHQHNRVLILGLIGILLLISAVLFGHDLVGELGEKLITVLGSALIAVGHIWNFKLCQAHEDCDCSQ